jgi:hypothetical protein
VGNLAGRSRTSLKVDGQHGDNVTVDWIAVYRVELGAYALLREFDDVRHQIEAAGLDRAARS